MAETCSVGQRHFGITKHTPCPAFQMHGPVGECALVDIYGPQVMGIDAGCCIAARVIDRKGGQHDFASLPPDIKTSLAQKVWAKMKERTIEV